MLKSIWKTNRVFLKVKNPLEVPDENSLRTAFSFRQTVIK